MSIMGNEDVFCKGCEYYGKPYWSVVSPCEHCPRTNGTTGYVTTTTVSVRTGQWSEPQYMCRRCGGGMRKNLMVTLTSYPPQFEYRCDRCRFVEYQFV